MEKPELFEKLKAEGKLGEIANVEQGEMHLEALLVVHHLSKLVEIGMLEFEGLSVHDQGKQIAEDAVAAGWKISQEHLPHLLHSLGVSPMDIEPLSFMVLEVEEHGMEGVKTRAAQAKKEIEAELSGFDENDWKHLHDAILHVTGLSIDSREHLKMIYLKLPPELKAQAKEHGMNDTVFRENVIETFKDFEK
jgi:hypothetical protein